MDTKNQAFPDHLALFYVNLGLIPNYSMAAFIGFIPAITAAIGRTVVNCLSLLICPHIKEEGDRQGNELEEGNQPKPDCRY